MALLKNNKKWINSEGVEIEMLEKENNQVKETPFFGVLNKNCKELLYGSYDKLMFALKKEYPFIIGMLKSTKPDYVIGKIMSILYICETIYLLCLAIFWALPLGNYLLCTFLLHSKPIFQFGMLSTILLLVFTILIGHAHILILNKKYKKL